MQKVAVKVSLRDSERPPVERELQVRPLELGSRVVHGLKRAGWAVLIFSPGILMPGIHFVIIPLAAVVVPAVFFLGMRGWVESATPQAIPCAKCDATISVPEGLVGWPMSLHCDACGNTTVVRAR